MKVLITQPRGKDNLVKAFKDAGALVLNPSHPFEEPDLIIPTVDEELPTMAYLRDMLPIAVSSPQTVDTCRDKAEFYRFCRRHEFSIPPTMQDFLIAKPRFGKASKGIIRLDRSYVVQPILLDPEYSVDYVGDWDAKPVSIIPRLRLNVVDGESQDCSIRMHEAILDTCERLGKELRLVGHCVIQGFFTGKEFVLSEVNPRFGGGSHFTFQMFNSPKWLMDNLSWRNARNVVDTQNALRCLKETRRVKGG